MIIAMVIASVLCILIGVFPQIFYKILPYQIDYFPYDFSHVIGQLQLLLFATLAFCFLWKFKIYPPELNSTVLNSDWFYRKFFPAFGVPIIFLVNDSWKKIIEFFFECYFRLKRKVEYIITHPISGPVAPGAGAMAIISVLFILLIIRAIFIN